MLANQLRLMLSSAAYVLMEDRTTDWASRHAVSPSPGDHDPREAVEDRPRG